MWSTHMWFILLFKIVILKKLVKCNPVTPNFNDNIREFSVKENDNSTVRTLQKEDEGRYANFAPIRNPIHFKEIPDNALSSTSFSRGLAHHDHGGYGYHEYEESPHYGYGYDVDHHGGFEHHPGSHHGPHGPHGPHGHYGYLEHHGGHGHHHKHYDHALAAKTILWPLAGLAILGTAAALVSNPVLLQLGVISGRRRRDIKEVSTSEYDFSKWNKEVAYVNDKDIEPKKVFKRTKQGVLFRKAYPTAQSTIESVTASAPENNSNDDEDRFVPVPLKFKKILKTIS